MRVSRRSLLAAAPLIACADSAAERPRALYVTPDGEGSGASWDDAAALATIEGLVRGVALGGEILIAADRGAYQVDQALEVTAGGRDGAPVRIRGVHSATGQPAAALVHGARGEGEMGNDLFRLLRGADYLQFSHVDFHAVGNGCFRVGAPISGLTIEDCTFEDVYRFLENTVSGDERQASLRRFAIRRCRGVRAERGFARIRYASADGVIEDCAAEGLANEGGDIPAGCALDGEARSITYRRCVMSGFQQWRAGDYWNGDGFSDESRNAGIRYEHCQARGSTDGGFDCKSRDVVLDHCIAEDNKRNFRIWSERATLESCTSRQPNFRGRGSEDADASHIWIGAEGRGRIQISDLTIADEDATQILEFEHDVGRVEIRGVTINSPRENWGNDEGRIRSGMLAPPPR